MARKRIIFHGRILRMNKQAWMRSVAASTTLAIATVAVADVPDLFSALEMGGRALGMGGGIYSNSSDVSSTYWNPAGLGAIRSSFAEVNFRNKPNANSSLSGRYDDPERSSTMTFGGSSITFAGFVLPLAGGTLGFSYATGGYTRDFGTGNNLTNPDNPGQTITKNELLRAQTDFFTIAFGKNNGRVNFGGGLIFAQQSISNRILSTDQNNTVLEDVDVSGRGWGIGGIIGVQFTPQDAGNVQFGLSFRSEIKLNGLDDVNSYASAIPARIQGGVAWRVDNLRGGRDYLIGGVDGMYFLPANSGKILKREGQISGGIGFEYNWGQSFGYVPVRIGFRITDKGGDNFGTRDVLTFGVGYRPTKEDFTIDLGFAAASGQSRPDVALSMSFALGK
jgi:hypothetical protein